MKKIFIVLGAVLLAGCASNKSKWQDVAPAPSAALMQQGTQCYEDMKKSPQIQPIVGKVAFNVNEQTVGMLSNTSKPTAKEKAAIAYWDQKRQECTKYWEAAYPSTGKPAVFVAISSAETTATQQAIADLYAGKLTYGQFAAKRRQIHDQTAAAQAQALESVNKQAEESAYRNRIVRAQEAQAEAARQAQYDAAIVQGANLINSTRAAPAAAGSNNITCIKQGAFTNCSGY